jgi:hypothetical protein
VCFLLFGSNYNNNAFYLKECINKENTMRIQMLKAALVGVVLSVSGLANAGVIYDSGSAVSDSNRCDAENCSGTTEWWALDDFTSYSDWNVTGFEFFSDGASEANYISTSWEIISSANPYGAALYSGTSVSKISGNSHLVSGLNFELSAGTYFLSHHHDYSTERNTTAMLTGESGSWYQTDKGSNQFSHTGELAQKIYGNVASVPEPTTLAIFALGLMGLASRRFKKQ